MNILVLNCGSSSIKYQLFDMQDSARVLAKGLLERIGLTDGILTHKPAGKDNYKVVLDIPDHTVGINMVMEALVHPVHGVIKSISEIKAVGHRVAHGGENFKESVLIDNDVKRDIEKCSELAPLHNPAHLKGILSCEKLLPGIPQVAVFDTSFHQTMPDYAFMYAIPYEYYEKYRIRKYGFHGTSHRFVAEKACRLLNMDLHKSKIITCHLGNGASITAIENGKSIDTSMGFTPVDGLIMGTRTGEIDPGVLLYLADKEELSVSGVNNMINKKSGVAGISQLSSDMRDLEIAANEGNPKALLALNMYAYKIKKFIGAYIAAMNGLDLLIFTAGVGENDFNARRMICERMDYVGIEIDEEVNHGIKGKDLVISKPSSKVKVMVVTTDEEFVIASDTKVIVEKLTR
ncbi:MAG: acetate kinase [Bacteroidales bacterium]|nr:acetate kinase [Bacteroidales bacterium]NLD64414.1 acetate kinase [Bacteroidales bacterium]HNT93532.1 acetate kinase [Bacteroidales bacterium]HOO66121.1 acetate kinase [Bacteroidales bacterium]HPE23521.1 acetate kinase [Bacteroidales bacterium]